MYELRHCCDPAGRPLFAQWLDGLRDGQARARIAARLIRLSHGNFGDCRPLREGVWEQRIDWGPGYRIYYAKDASHVLLLCSGGDKRTQSADIERAIERWSEWQSRRRK
jgi:putative addiction module killer protein